MSELQQRVPGQALIEKLLKEFEAGRIRVEQPGDRVIIDEKSLSWYQGVLGELHVGEVLSHLGSEFTVLHAVPFKRGDSDIDHVVLGPGGVTIINTKHTRLEKVWSAGYGIYVGGSAQPGYIKALVGSVQEAERRLSEAVGMAVPVRGILCFVGPDGIDRKDAAGGGEYDVPVEVVTARELLGTLHRRRELSDEQLRRIVGAAGLPTTWHDSPKPHRIGSHITREFLALQIEVGQEVEQMLAARDAVREAERVARRAARGSSASRPASTSRRQGTAPAPGSAPSHVPSRVTASPRRGAPAPAGERPAAPRSRGAAALGVWPLLVSALVCVSAALSFAITAGYGHLDPGPGLGIAWLLLLLLPLAAGALDVQTLQRAGAPVASAGWILLGPLPYLIARTVALHRTGLAGGAALILHLLSGGLGLVAMIVVSLIGDLAAAL